MRTKQAQVLTECGGCLAPSPAGSRSPRSNKPGSSPARTSTRTTMSPTSPLPGHFTTSTYLLTYYLNTQSQIIYYLGRKSGDRATVKKRPPVQRKSSEFRGDIHSLTHLSHRKVLPLVLLLDYLSKFFK